MGAAEELVGGSASPQQDASPPPPSIAHGRPRFSLHRVLGGGAVADVILWRRRNPALLLLAGATAAWYLFEIAGYSFLSLLANALLLLVAILFFWARSASLLNRPLPPLPNLEISDRVVEKVAVEVRPWINRALAVARGIALDGDRKLFLEVIVCLWAVSYIGSFCSFLTLVYLGVIFCLTFPMLYDKYQDHVDEKVALVHSLVLNQYENILVKTGRSVKKEKKTE
uniref:Reticulon-like protein n=1 Tax=Anthurium amnicola TaxID=1678845 RepID=A0A1D1Y9Y0_9ARAE